MDRELRRERRFPPGDQDELMSEMVEGRSQVVKEVPDKGTPNGRECRGIPCLEDVLDSLVVDLGHHDVSVTWKHPLKVPFKGSQVVFRLFDFDQYAVERGLLPPALSAHGSGREGGPAGDPR